MLDGPQAADPAHDINPSAAQEGYTGDAAIQSEAAVKIGVAAGKGLPAQVYGKRAAWSSMCRCWQPPLLDSGLPLNPQRWLRTLPLSVHPWAFVGQTAADGHAPPPNSPTCM